MPFNFEKGPFDIAKIARNAVEDLTSYMRLFALYVIEIHALRNTSTYEIVHILEDELFERLQVRFGHRRCCSGHGSSGPGLPHR